MKTVLVIRLFDKEYLLKLLNEKPKIGNDIDFSEFTFTKNTKDIPSDIDDKLKEVGIDLSEKERSATFIQNNERSLYQNINKMFNGKLEIMPLKDALSKYEWLKDYYFKAVKMKDKFTAYNELYLEGGYFLRVFKDQKIEIPIQACFLISTNNAIQNVHNIIILEEGSSAHMINGCTAQYAAKKTLHLAVTEIYLKKNSKFIYNMIHNWSEKSYVRPRTGIIIDDNAKFISNYITLYKIKDIQSYPKAICKGEKSSATFRTIAYGKNDAYLDLGGSIILEGDQSSGEIISHTVVSDSSINIARSSIISKGKGTKGHIECKAIMVSDKARMKAIPILDSFSKDAELTHEASIGKIDEEKLEYLMSRGFTKDDAISLIVKGFLDVEEMELTPYVKDAVRKIIEKTSEGW